MLLYSTHTVVTLCKPPLLTHRSFCKFRYTEPRHRSGPLNQRSSRTRGRGREIFLFEGETRGEAIHSYTPSSYLPWSKPQSARVGFQINERDRLKLAETKLPTSSNRGSYSRLIGKSLNLPLPKKGTDEGGDHTHV